MRRMPNWNFIFIFILVVFFVSGFFMLLNGDIQIYSNKSLIGEDSVFSLKENFDDASNQCPDVLIKDGSTLLLFNSKEPTKDGVNPKKLKDLDEYSDYLEEQNKKGLNCPVLFLQKENDAQNKDVYRIRQSPFYIEGGLPALPVVIHDNSVPIEVKDASRENGYNTNMYPGFDPYNFDVGRYTTIDVIHESTNKTPGGSLNPADSNWLGVIPTQVAVDNGVFKENEVSKVIYPKQMPPPV